MSAAMNKPEAMAAAASEHSITFTTWASRTNTRGKKNMSTWDDLKVLLRDPPKSRDKAQCEMLKLATFRKGCKAEDLEAFYGIEGDYDGGVHSIDEGEATLSETGLDGILYTSASHTPEKPRWRVLVRLSRPHTKDEHAALMDLLNGAMGGILAPESWTPAQRYYYGKVDGVTYDCRSVEGACLDELDLLITPIGKRPAPASNGKLYTVPAREGDDLERGAALHEVTAETIGDLREAVACLAIGGHMIATSGFTCLRRLHH